MHPWDCALAFMDSQVLLAAEELGIFTILEKPSTVAQVAHQSGLPVDSAARLLAGLCALGFVERTADTFVNSAEASEQLVRGKPGYIGDMFQHVREDLYPLWQHFRGALVEGRAQWDKAFDQEPISRHERMYTDQAILRSFMDGMHAITYEAAAEFAEHAAELREVKTIVDLGGASGAFVIALAERHPQLAGTVMDFFPVQPIAEDFFRKHGLSGRLRFHAGDFFEDPIPAGADAYALGFVLHDWSTEEGSELLRRVANASREGAMLIVSEFLLDDSKCGPHFVVRSDLNMLVAAKGRERSAAEYTAWMERHGFQLRRIQPTSKGKAFLVADRLGSSVGR